MLKSSGTWNLKPSGKVMNFEGESKNCILHLMNDVLRVDCLEQHYIILRKVRMSSLCRHCRVSLEDYYCRVNVIGYELDIEPICMNL